MYYPKSQIKTNLVTNGDEFVLDGRTYEGDYYETSDGQFFTGKSPSNPPNKKLTVRVGEGNTRFEDGLNITDEYPGITNVDNSVFEIDYEYWDAKNYDFNNPPSAPLPPMGSMPKPTEQDYRIGEFNRYYLKKTNEFQFIEVSEFTYNKFKNKDNQYQYQLYIPIKINWILTGKPENVFNVNKSIVLLAEKNFKVPGFRSIFLNNYLKYYLAAEIEENLETDGTEYKNRRTGVPYIGKYHIHPEKGPMVGAIHIKEYHDYLVPIDEILSSDGIYTSSIDYNNARQTNSRSSGGY